ncbi:hypothetical protein [Pseudoalteromonas xiamenensis]
MTKQIDLQTSTAIFNTLTSSLGDFAKQTVFEENLPIEAWNFDFAAGKGKLSGDLSIELFNSKDDTDSDAIIGVKPSKVDMTSLSPAIEFDGNACWMKYKVKTTLKGSAQHSINDLAIGTNANVTSYVSAYKRHDANKFLGQTIVSDLQVMPFVFDQSDLENLSDAEAMVFDTVGTLKAEATFSWGDIFAQRMSLFSKWLGEGEVINLKLDASLKAKIHVVIEGGFKVVFSKDAVTPSNLRVGIKRSSNRGVGVDVSAGITAQLQETLQFNSLVDETLEAIFKQPQAVVDAIANYVSLETLEDGDKQVVEALFVRFGLDDEVEQLQKLQAKVQEVKESVASELKKAASEKAELSFAYEYARLSASKSILEVVVKPAKFGEVHQLAISGRILDITALSQQSADIAIEHFFWQKSTTIEQSWGFNLGFAKWKASSKDFDKIQYIENRDTSGLVQLSTVAKRGYQDKVGGNKRNFYIEFDAVMPDYEALQAITVNSFDLSLNLAHTLEEGTVDASDIENIVDDLIIWDLASLEQISELKQELETNLIHASNIKFIKLLHVKPEGLRKLLPLMASLPTELLAKSLAVALPLNSGLKEVRSTGVRAFFYAPIFDAILQGSLKTTDEIADSTSRLLRKYGYSDAGKKEKDWRKKGSHSLIAHVCQTHPSIRIDVEHLIEGFALLNQAVALNGKKEVLVKAYRLFDDMGEHGFYVRFFGHLLLNIAKQDERVYNLIERSLKVEYTQDGVPKEFVLFRR